MITKLLRQLIREELGRDLESPRPDPMTWRSFPGIHVVVIAAPSLGNGAYQAQVTVEDEPSLSTPMRSFNDESSAMFWAREKAEAAHRKLLNQKK
jgi:hypothetical protein